MTMYQEGDQQSSPHHQEQQEISRSRQLASKKDGNKVLITVLKQGTYSENKDTHDLPFPIIPQNGDTVKIHYEAYLNGGPNDDVIQNRRQIDSSRKRDVPFCFVLGKGQVIDGLDYAVQNMELHQTVEVIIPYIYGYGPNGFLPKVPPQSTLIFHVELLDFTSGDVTEREWTKA